MKIAGENYLENLDDMTGTPDILQMKSQTTQSFNDVYAINFFGGSGRGDPLDRERDRVANGIWQFSALAKKACDGAIYPHEVKVGLFMTGFYFPKLQYLVTWRPVFTT